MTRLRLWVTPATVVIAVALAAVTAGMSLRGVDVIRDRLTAPPPATPQPTYTVPGTLRIAEYATEGATCSGTTIGRDAQIVVTDRADAALTYAPIGAGAVVDGMCALPFTLVVPAGAGEYGVDFPQYGLMRYTEQQLADLLDLTIG